MFKLAPGVVQAGELGHQEVEAHDHQRDEDRTDDHPAPGQPAGGLALELGRRLKVDRAMRPVAERPRL
jgi:hypothetical protein